MSTCTIGEKDNCVPTVMGEIMKFNDKMQLSKSISGVTATVVGEGKGTDKGAVKRVKSGNNYYFVYTDLFKCDDCRRSRHITRRETEKYISTRTGVKLSEILKEIEYTRKLLTTNVVPRIITSKMSLAMGGIRLVFVTQDLHARGFRSMGEHLDNGTIRDISFVNTPGITRPTDKHLNHYIRNLHFPRVLARFIHKQNFEKNLESWFKANIKFFVVLFASLHKIHRRGVYHHDLHAENVWYSPADPSAGRPRPRVMFIDMGRASNMAQSFTPSERDSEFQIREKSRYSKVKDRFKKMMLAELCKNPGNPSTRHEFFRHDIDDRLMVEHFYKREEFHWAIEKFKLFLAKKYSKIVRNSRVRKEYL
jgi:hypothetical protein